MTTTPHLALPLLAAAQAQKHVTHNEALAVLDALVQLSVRERNRADAPAAPEEGVRYLVGADAAGAFVGHGDEIALFDLGAWRFFAPQPGWQTYVEAEDILLVFDGTAWQEIGHYVRSLERLERLGIGTAPDDVNRLSARLNAALFAARTVEEGGTGDLRFVLNKAQKAGILSQLYQRAFSGRAETGLVGSDDFSIRVSPDGLVWRDALVVDCATGRVSFPSGVAAEAGANLLMNADFAIDQRGFPGGDLAEGRYGFDRWRAGPGGAALTLAADGAIALRGAVEQVVDVALAGPCGLEDFAAVPLTLSVEDPSAPLDVTVGATTVLLPAGSGRCAITVTTGSGETGPILVRIATSGDATFRRPKLETGHAATPWRGPSPAEEALRCRHYYQRLPLAGGAPSPVAAFGQRRGGNLIEIPIAFPVPMRAAPALVSGGPAWASGPPSGNQIAFFNNGSGAWESQFGGVTLATAAPPGPGGAVLHLQAGAYFSGTAGTVGLLHCGDAAVIGFEAEI